MFSKKSIFEGSVLLFLEDILDEWDMLAVYEAFKRKNPSLPYWNYPHFDVNNLSEDECKTELRFGKGEIPILADVLEIPETFTCPNGTVATGTEALCMLLKRFAYPCRLSDMIPRFGRSVPEMSLILSEVCNFIYDNHGHLLTDLNQPWLDPHCLEEFAEAIHRKGAALDNCWGFVDGTVRPLCRPGENQRMLYNGHKRIHAIKFQSIVAPNGLVANLYGPVEGKRHDAGMLRMSNLLAKLQQHAYSTNGQPLCIYGDPAYPVRLHLQSPFRGAQPTQAQTAFNSSMSAVRVAVEWVFNDITSYFAFLDFKKNLKIGLNPVGKMYCVCALLRNALTCLYGSSTSSFFEVQPPSIYEYFQV